MLIYSLYYSFDTLYCLLRIFTGLSCYFTRLASFKLYIYNYHWQVSHCWLGFNRIDCIFTWLTEVSQGTVKLIRFTIHFSLGVSQGAQEFHMMLLKAHFKLKFSQHISHDEILYHFLYQKYIFISQDVSHSKLGSHVFHMLFTCFSQGLSWIVPSSPSKMVA